MQRLGFEEIYGVGIANQRTSKKDIKQIEIDKKEVDRLRRGV